MKLAALETFCVCFNQKQPPLQVKQIPFSMLQISKRSKICTDSVLASRRNDGSKRGAQPLIMQKVLPFFFGDWQFYYTTLYLREINDYRLIGELNLTWLAELNDRRLNMINVIIREHSVQLLVRFLIRNIFHS